MPDTKSEQQKFLEELEVDNKKEDVLDKPLIEPTVEEPKEDVEIKLKNRRERRLSAKLQAEREANIALNARLQGITEAKKLENESAQDEFLKIVEPIYGTDTPEKRQATELLQKALLRVKESSKEELRREMEETRRKETEEDAKDEQTLQAGMDELEDEHGVDFSNKETRQGFLSLLEKLSPKDHEGNITEYADFDAVYEIYEARKEKASRAKELASRGMTHSTTSQSPKPNDNTVEQYLRENGII